MSFRDRFLVAVDPSLTASGWAVFSLARGTPCAVGVIEPPGPSLHLADRMSALQQKVDRTFRALALGEGDILVCEGPAPLVLNPQSALKVEGVRGVFETVARSLGLTVPGRVNPRTVQTELLGMRGPQLARSTVKEWARGTAERLYGEELVELFHSYRKRSATQSNASAACDDNQDGESERARNGGRTGTVTQRNRAHRDAAHDSSARCKSPHCNPPRCDSPRCDSPHRSSADGRSAHGVSAPGVDGALANDALTDGGRSKSRRRVQPQALPQDIVDAILIGTFALTRVRLAESSGISLEVAFMSHARSRRFAGGGARGTGWSERDLDNLCRVNDDDE